MAVVTMKNLLESGVHFGHQVKRWDPRMKKYIFAERNGIHIIDLQKTIAAIKESYEAVRKITASGKSVLFVGTKKQAQQAIQKEAERCGMFYVLCKQPLARWNAYKLFYNQKITFTPQKNRKNGSRRNF